MNVIRFFICFYILICIFSVPHLARAKVWDAYSIVEQPANNMCALTFDDGPSHLTPKFLDALKDENVKVTFFVLGMQAARYPELVKRMVEEGHEVGSHSYAHDDLRLLPPDAVYADLKKTANVLQKSGVTPRFLRPPYGKYNKDVVSIANELGMSIALWSVDSRDWEGQPDYGNMPNILNRPMNADEMRGVFLFHDTKIRTVRDIKLIIMILKAVGCKHFVTLSEYFDPSTVKKLYDMPPLVIAKPDLKIPKASSTSAWPLNLAWKPSGLLDHSIIESYMAAPDDNKPEPFDNYHNEFSLIQTLQNK